MVTVMQRNRNTKIIATLGPNSVSLDMIESLFQAGVDVFRLNFSHGNHQEHAQTITYIRSIEKKHDVPIASMADLQGPKIRIGMFEHGSIVLKEGDAFCLDKHKKPGTKERVYLPHDAVFDALQNGDHILLDDGKIKLIVQEKGSDFILTIVERGGKLSSKKGVNLPDSKLPIPALTEKDKEDIAFCLTQDIDFIALSFIQNTQDILDARALIGDHAKIISKIEKPQALENIDDIILHSDGILLARGDLGVEVNLQNVPMIQKDIIQRCRALGRPVGVATQMLESMI
ncbi:MAG: pyruvate kinase, partial [Flavobacteriaceae bacterium]|nr:pyruvate kinase [Flavobacteriaceae bacterium]